MIRVRLQMSFFLNFHRRNISFSQHSSQRIDANTDALPFQHRCVLHKLHLDNELSVSLFFFFFCDGLKCC